jgi:SAM-dependent methyltransferase
MSVEARGGAEALWHDVECGGYGADLALWHELAASAAGPVLELGAGTGRVALRLALAGAEVVALDSSAALLAELEARAAAAGAELQTVHADAPELDLGMREFAAILAPMQFIHLVGGRDRRLALLRAARRHLRRGGTLAAALLAEDAALGSDRPESPPLPDVREHGGWVYSSMPLEVRRVADGFEIRRLRQIVSPAGELSESADSVRLHALSPGEFEAEGREVGLEVRERIAVPPTDDHVGSIVCVLEEPR